MSDAGKIVIADDSAANLHALGRMFARQQYEVHIASNGAAALDLISRETPDVVLSDVVMPRMDGFELCRRIKKNPQTAMTPVILMTGRHEPEDRMVSINAGADDFITKPFSAEELVARAGALLHLKRTIDKLDSAESVILTLATTIEARDPYTHGHCERLARYASLLGQTVNLSDEDIWALQKGGYLHDIGKIAVPDSVLLKPTRLTTAEFEALKRHSVIGERLCGNLRSLAKVRPIVRYHHERLDGSGYPDGLRGDEIPLLAQIIGIVDTFDAVTTTRPYREGHTREQAYEQLRSDAGRGLFEPGLVEAFISVVGRELFDESDGHASGGYSGSPPLRQHKLQPPGELILVVDDDADARELLEQTLAFEGYRVVSARNGAEALTIARRDKPRLIMLDLMMPVMDGYEFRSRQRADPAIADIPIICISGTLDAQRAAELLGAIACFEKPIAFNDIAAAVKAHVTGKLPAAEL